MSHFDKAIIEVLRHEGGYVNSSADPGGETNYGICKRIYPKLDIKNLTKADAIAIYRRDYWRQYYDKMPYEVACKTFDMAVNMGHGQAHKILQRAVHVADDAIIGEKTLEAINAQPVSITLNNITAEQLRVYGRIIEKRPASKVFLAGWTKRAEWEPVA